MTEPRATSDDAHRWERVQALFHAALDRPEAEREAFLVAACGNDDALRTEVLALIAADAEPGSILDRGVATIARDVLDRPVDTSLPTQTFGAYRVVGLLGEGGMGVVYHAVHREIGSQAAIKILRDASLSPARRARFSSEQRLLGQLDHASIARIYDADTLPDGTPWFVMEYVDGVPLGRYCTEHECSTRERLELFRTVCLAVQHAHQHAIVHRDLKPSNILVKPDGSVKLLDFGISKQLEGDEPAVDPTRTGFGLMTPAYAAPEQFTGGPIGIHTDVYALGVVLYELLAGRLPFDLSDRTPGEMEAMVATQEPDKPSVAARVAGPGATASRAEWDDLDVLCLTAMHKDPARRYRTVDALVRDVDRFLAGEALEARPDSFRYRTSKFTRRHWRPLTAAAVVLAVLAGVVIFYTVRLTIARNVAIAGAARTQRIQRFMTNLFEGGDPDAGPSDSLRVVTLIDRGVEQARGLEAEPAVQAELLQTLGTAYRGLGRLEQADSLLRLSLDRRRAALGPDNADVAHGLIALGLLRADQAQLDEADSLVKLGYAMIKRHVPPGDPAIAAAATAHGQVLELRGEYDRAIPLLEESVRLQEVGGKDSPDLAASLSALANTLFYAGRYGGSDSLNERVLAMSRRMYGAHHPAVANDLINIGAIRFELGHYDEAERYFKQALEINRAWYGDDHPETASNYTMLARAILFLNRFDEATKLLQHSLAIQEHVYGPVHPKVASTLNEIGNIALQQDRYDEAEAAFRRMAAIYKQVYNDKHYLICIAESNLASVYLARKQYPQAEALFRDVIARYSGLLAPDHMNVGISRIKLGRTLVREKRFADAVKETRAGYEIVVKQSDPAISFLRAARQDLIAEYDALAQPALAARFRAELADTATAAK